MCEMLYKERRITCIQMTDAIWENVSNLLNKTFLPEELSEEKKTLIWDNRFMCYQMPASLPLVLSCCPKWTTETLSEISGISACYFSYLFFVQRRISASFKFKTILSVVCSNYYINKSFYCIIQTST